MQTPLKDYQREGVKQILKTLARTKSDWHEHHEQSAFALSAPTSSGKTVMAAAAIEATLYGSDEFDVDPDPSAVFLWVSKDPALNEQTKARFRQHSDRIPLSALVTLDKDFTGESLKTGHIYFINPQKLAVSGGFVKHTFSRQFTFWDILATTIKDPKKSLYMVLDEAHEGMRPPTSSDQTIVMRMINGNGSPGVPVVWGISATLARFTKAMENTPSRVKRPNIEIDPLEVQASGLIKTGIHLDIPDEVGEFSTTLIRDATSDFVDVCRRWDAYTQSQGIDEPVIPLMVVQIPNKAAGESETAKGRQEEEALILHVLNTIRQGWPDLPADGVAHVLGESRGAISAGPYVIPRVEPQDVQGKTHIRVLIAKDAISTGWDCPRAEVLLSLRPGKDPTYVTQLIGRMVRTPLAQTTSVDRLNSAACYLPKFDLATTKAVVDELLGKSTKGANGSSTSLVQKVLLKPISLRPNPHIPPDVLDLVQSLPSYARPSAVARPIKRLLKAAQAFGQDGLVEEPNKLAHQTLFGVLDGIAADHAVQLEEHADEILTANIRRIHASFTDGEITEEHKKRAADVDTVDDALRHMRRVLTTSVVSGYLSRDVQTAITQAEEDGGGLQDVDINAIRARVAAIGMLEVDGGVQAAVEDAADVLTRHWLQVNAGKISTLSDSRRAVYDEVRGMARRPELAPLEVQTDEQVDSVDGDLNPLPTAERHVVAGADGRFPLDAKLNRWERAAIAHELANASVRGWYRNPSVATKHSLRVPYQAGDGWKSVQPDLVFVTESEDGSLRPSIIDPHGAHLGDALPKLKALAQYADQHGSLFERIIAVGAEKDDHLIGIDLLDPAVRAAVYGAQGDKASVEALFTNLGTKYAQLPA